MATARSTGGVGGNGANGATHGGAAGNGGGGGNAGEGGQGGGQGGVGGAGGGAGNAGDSAAATGGGSGGSGGNGGKGGNGGTGGQGGGAGQATEGGSPDGAGGQAGTRGANGSPTAAAAAVAAVSAHAQPATPAAVFEEIGRRLAYIFFNRAPSAGPEIGGQDGTDKQITVTVGGSANNGYGVTYTIKDQPKYGTVTAGEAPGTFVYTANQSLIQPGITDSFTVRIDNGSDARLPGFAGLLQDALHNFAIRIGAAKSDTIDEKVTVTVTGTGVYGNAEDAKQYWVSQSYSNCVLQAAAAAVSQATKTPPPSDIEQQWVDWAKTTDSVANPGSKMYLDQNTDEAADPADARVLMQMHYNVTVAAKEYAQTQAGGQEALRDLQAALAEGKAVVVGYPVAIVWGGAGIGYEKDDDDSYTDADHAAVVTEVDMKKGLVYVNDSSMTENNAPVGQGKALPIGVFMAGWQVSKYGLTTVGPKTL
ncbi:Ig-like domain-containing protein [Mycobacterium sp. EPa45]|uniref:Ig-like domain-containing protein n=1 Tax=Mycobacterium sp. EPa45 TaxID=1545728 RepID=UPI00069BF920|nr:Ig-like domain-containing protein [Mycobacterium sp. EPa45]